MLLNEYIELEFQFRICGNHAKFGRVLFTPEDPHIAYALYLISMRRTSTTRVKAGKRFNLFNW
jgi:hypothetical protein